MAGGRHRPVCGACGFVHYKNPAAGVATVVIHEGRVVFGRYGPTTRFAGKWALPAGFIEYGESFLEAATRETWEETGLEIELTGILNVASNLFAPNLHTLVVTLTGRVVGGDLVAGDDFDAVAWLPLHGPFPELASWGDAKVLELYRALEGHLLPVDPRFATR
jgi:8-oxo-dGTP diphosphatase